MTIRIDVNGAGEQNTPNAFLAKGLFYRRDNVRQVVYPAAIGPVNLTPDPHDFAGNYDDSVRRGKDALVNMIMIANQTGQVPGIAGYSLGASVVSLLLEEMATGAYSNVHIRWALTIASPRAAFDRSGCGGIAGPHLKYPNTVTHVEIRNDRDIISSTPRGSILRSLPYIERAVSAGLPRNVRDDYRRLVFEWLWGRGIFPTPNDWDLLRRYVDGTGHGRDYFNKNLFTQAKWLP